MQLLNSLINRSIRSTLFMGVLAFHGLVVFPVVLGAVRDGEKMAESLPPAERSGVVGRTLSAVRDNYVFPERTPRIEADVHRRNAAGEYDAAESGHELARSISEDMQVAADDNALLLEYLALPVLGETPPGTVRDVEPLEAWPQSWITRVRRSWDSGGVWNVKVLDGNVGFLQIHKFDHFYNARGKYAEAMDKLKDTRAVIIDLRQNAGGWPEAVNTFATYFFDQRVHLDDIYYRKQDLTVQNWTDAEPLGPRYGAKRPVYILTSPNTHGAAESFAYSMQKMGRATVIGRATRGSAHLSDRFPLSEHFQAWVPVARAVNATTGGNWQSSGVKPDVEAIRKDAMEIARRMAMETAGMALAR
ncbi:S41 family peptidase [Pseudoduganella aquatica]|uniref:S41 family peptidase n=1 Tax=Pseudoduganella aquatica TaxID=2660641 RepID=UPI001E6580B3|nr:S41 family peptidase [Pseudoduganella aquatica]